MSSNQSVFVELVRGKNYPMLNEDFGSFNTRVVCSLLDPAVWQPLAEPRASRSSSQSCSPFYRETIHFVVPASYDAVLLHVSVDRQTGPTEFEPLNLFATEKVALRRAGAEPDELTVYLDPKDKLCSPDDAAAPSSARTSSSPLLILRVASTPIIEPHSRTRDDDDVAIDEKSVALNASQLLVPARSRYVWMHLLLDKAWQARYTHALVAAWQQRPPLTEGALAMWGSRSGKHANPRRFYDSADKNATNSSVSGVSVASVGDVIRLRWGCTRVHQILTRVRLTAEKFCGNPGGHDGLIFTPDEEQAYRMERLHRATIITNMCIEKHSCKEKNELRDELNNAYAAFVTGVDVGSNNKSRVLSYELRKTIYDAQFTDDDAIILNAYLLHHLVPSLSCQFYESLCQADCRFTRSRRPPIVSNFEVDDTMITNAQRFFTVVLSLFIGSLVDTLTEVELVKALSLFRPAIIRAHKCIAGGGKERLRERPDSSGNVQYIVGDGIPISHLDKLGRRKEAAKFT